MTTIQCPQCSHPVKLGKNFCGNCAYNLSSMSATRPCPKCGADNSPAAKFCGGCAHDLRSHVNQPEAIVSGEWSRGETEFVRQITPSEMESRWGGKRIKVPNGSIAVVVKNGEVVEVLQPGQRTTVSMFENLWGWIQGGINASFYLINCSPIPFVTSMKMKKGNTQIGFNVSVQAYIYDKCKDFFRLNRFLSRVVKEHTIVTLEDIHKLLRNKIFTKVRRAMEMGEKHGDHHGQVMNFAEGALTAEITQQYGFSFSVNIVPTNSLHTINLHIGTEELPRVKRCCSDKCKKEINYTALFCGKCGQKQPRNLDKAQKVTLISADHRPLELDMIFQLLGAGDFEQNEDMVLAISSAAAGVVRQMKTEEILSTDGFRKIEAAINQRLKEVLIGFELQKVGVLDVRDKNGQWVLNAQADIARIKDELTVNHQMMELEGQELDLQALAYDMVLRRQEMQLDLDFRRLELDLEHKRKEAAAQIDDQFLRDEMGLNDRVRRADLLSQNANLDIEEAVRNRKRNIAIDQEQRLEQRYQKKEDHQDWKEGHARNKEVLHANLELQQELEKKNQGFDQEMETSEQAHAQSLESSQMKHELEMEKETVKQNIWIQDQEVGKTIRHNEALAESNNKIDLERSKIDDEILRRQAEREDEKARRDIETALFAEKGQRDLEFEDDFRRNEMEQDNLDKAHGREQDALQSDHDRGMETMKAQMAHDLALDQQQASHEESLRKMEQEERLAEIEANRDIAMNEDRIQAAVDQKAREEAELRARLTKEMYEGFDKKKDDLFDKILERDAKRDEENRKMMGMLAEGLSGARSREAEAQKEVSKAYQEGAQQAKDMANTSMNTMSHVAGVRADQRPVYTNSKGKQVEPPQSPYQPEPPKEHKPDRPMGFRPAAQKPTKKEQPKQALRICEKCGKDPGDGRFCEQCAHKQF